jgi:transcriptional regulator with XRE-family HTH domain
MPGNVSPEVRRRRLAAELRRLRGAHGFKTTDVARALGWSPSKVSRYELARTGLKPADVRAMLTFYEVDARHQDELLALAEEASERGWWEDFSDVLSEEQIALTGLEDEATSEWVWHMEVVPGLLQTEEYARAVNSKGYSLAPPSPSQIERSVEVRMKRQKLLTRDPPLALSVVLDEGVLRRRVGGPDVMREQLRRLFAVGQLPNVSLRVLRLEDDPPILMNPFELLRFGEEHARMPDIAYTEHFRATLRFEDDDDTHQYRVVFRRLQEGALGEMESLGLINQILRQIGT